MYFLNYGLQETWLDKCLKSPISENPSTSHMGNEPNTVEISTTEPLPCLLITVKAIELGKVSLSDMQNLQTVC